LYGTVGFKSVSSGWLISTAELGKDAKGLQIEWENRPTEERAKLRIYTPDRLVDLLINSGKIINYESLKLPANRKFSEENYLLITNYGRFWAKTLINVEAGIPYAVMLFDARSGDLIKDINIVEQVSVTDSTLQELEWLTEGEVNQITLNNLLVESESVLEISPGESWVDYRPSRPQDFVGRAEFQNKIYNLLDKIREQNSSTRVIAIKSPSGWGKSSVVLKLVNRSKNIRNKNKYYMHAVDVRAASSPRYGELALIDCFKHAMKEGFIPLQSQPITLSGTHDPLRDSSIRGILDYLKENKKVLILFFDQFEEIFSKKELLSLFSNIKNLCSAIDSAQENIILGFAWKTDGTVPQDHPAYFMWHNLSDRRAEFTLTPFSSTEISSALTSFSREINIQLNPVLRRHLNDHCKGYPWLLKKLCIHVYNLLVSGIDQGEILSKSLNIGELFEKDLQEIAGQEYACIKRIAQESPAEFFQIEELFGGDVLQSVINKRLVIRRGSRLVLYWDIFRDYVLTGTTPNIPISYIPQTGFRRYCDAVTIIIKEKNLSLTDFAKKMEIADPAADNIARDMVMVGNIEREGNLLQALQSTEEEASITIFNFLSNHQFLKELVSEKSTMAGKITIDEAENTLRTLYSDTVSKDNTSRSYTIRLLKWFTTVGILQGQGNAVQYSSSGPKMFSLSKLKSPFTGRVGARRGTKFLGQAPPEKVIELIRKLTNSTLSKAEILTLGYRNSLDVLYALDVVSDRDENIILNEDLTQVAEEDFAGDIDSVIDLWLLDIVSSSQTMIWVQKYLAAFKKARPKEIGTLLEKELQCEWSESSKLRYGSALRRWAKWIDTHSEIYGIYDLGAITREE